VGDVGQSVVRLLDQHPGSGPGQALEHQYRVERRAATFGLTRMGQRGAKIDAERLDQIKSAKPRVATWLRDQMPLCSSLVMAIRGWTGGWAENSQFENYVKYQ
jgi:hypothetical protein